MNLSATTQRRFEIPPGFERPGWLCTCCGRAVHNIPDHVDGTQKCPHCRKWAVEWVPPLEPEPEVHPLTSEEAKANRKCGQYVTKEQAAALFAEMKAKLEAAKVDEVSPEDY